MQTNWSLFLAHGAISREFTIQWRHAPSLSRTNEVHVKIERSLDCFKSPLNIQRAEDLFASHPESDIDNDNLIL